MSLYDLQESLGMNSAGNAVVNLSDAFGQNPVEHAERRKLEKQTGTPATLMDDPEVMVEAKKQAYVKGLALSHTPATSKFAENPNNAPLMYDDMDNLTSFEDRIKKLPKRSMSTMGIAGPKDIGTAQAASDFLKSTSDFMDKAVIPTPARAYAAYQQGTGGMYQWIGEMIGWDGLAQQGKSMHEDAKAVEEFIQKDKQIDPDSWTGATAVALQSMYLQAPLMAAGSLAATVRGATSVTLGGMGMTTAGQTYADRREKGFSPVASGWSAAFDGAVEVGTEIMPTSRVFEMLKPTAKASMGKLMTSVAKLYGEEMVGESIATFMQDANNRFMGNPGQTAAQRVDAIGEYVQSGEALTNWLNTIKTTFIQTSLMAGSASGINRIRSFGKDSVAGRTQQQAEHTAQLVEAIIAAEGSRLLTNSPETFTEFAQRVGEEHGHDKIYFQADKLINEAVNQGIPKAQIPEWLSQYGVDPVQLATDLKTGGTIAIDFGSAVANFKNDGVLQALQSEFLVSPDMHGLADAEKGIQIESAHLERLNDIYAADQAKKVDAADVEAWKQEILGRPELGKYIKEEHLDSMAARANALSKMTGMPAIDFVNEMLLPYNIKTMRFKDFQKQRQENAGMDVGVLNAIRTGNGIPTESQAYGPSLIDFLRDKGGIKDQGGELAAMDAHAATKQAFKKNFVNESGMNQDTARELAVEAGYLNADATIADLLDMIGAELSGTPKYSANNRNDAVANKLEKINETRAMFEQFGVDPTGDIDEILQKLSDMHTEQDDLPFQADEKTGLVQRPDETLEQFVDRRNSTLRDKLVAEMTPEEKDHALLLNELTHIPNRRAYHEDEAKNGGPMKIQVSVDADSLKFVNDNMGHHAGDNMLIAIAEALHKSSLELSSRGFDVRVYHVSGDEFIVQSDNEKAVAFILNSVDKILAGSIIKSDQVEGYFVETIPHITYGVDNNGNLKRADKQLQESKRIATDRGVRAERGEPPYTTKVVDRSDDGKNYDYNDIKSLFKKLEEERKKAREEAAKKGTDPADVNHPDNVAARFAKLLQGNPLFQSAWHGTPHTFDKSLASDGIGDSPLVKGFTNRMVSDAQVLTDFVNTPPFIEKGLDGFDIPTQNAQLSRVARLIENDKIRKLVVESIPVDMMNMLIEKELSADMLLHDVTVFRDLFTLDRDNFVSLPVDMTSRLVDIVAFTGTKELLSSLYVGKGAGKLNTAKLTLKSWHDKLPPDFSSIISETTGITTNSIFSDDDVAITAMYQSQQNNYLAALTQDADGNNVVNLFAAADKSSFLHEAGHIFLNHLKLVAEKHNLQTAEWQAAKEWLGIGDDGIITREQHEQFAEHWEVYLMEGKSPTPELRGAFRSFKRWLTAIYENVKSGRFGQRDGIVITPEIKDLFDRLLATEEEIQEAKDEAALIAMLDDKMLNGTGFSAEEIAAYQKIVMQAEDSARERMDKHKMIGREERLAGWKEQAERDARGVPVYAFQEWMSDIGIDPKSAAQYGEVPSRTVFKAEGEDINVAIAEHGSQFGYENATDFMHDVRTYPIRQQWMEKRVAQLEAAYDLAQDTQEAIRTTSLRRQLELESNWLERKIKQKRMSEERAQQKAEAVDAAKQAAYEQRWAQAEEDMLWKMDQAKATTPKEVMKEWAERTVASRTMTKIRSISKLVAESAKHRKESIAAARAGDWETALQKNEQARMTEALITASYAAANKFKQMQSRLAKIAKWTNDNKSVKVGENFRDQINRLMQQYAIANKEFNPNIPSVQDFAANLIDGEDDIGAVLPEWIGIDPTDQKNLTWHELQELHDALNYLYKHGRDEVEGKKLANGQYVSAYASDILMAQGDIKGMPNLKSDATKFGKLWQGVQKGYRKFFANTGILRFIAQRMDGYKNIGKNGQMGPAEQLVQNVINGMAASNDLWIKVSAEIEPQLAVLFKNRNQQHDDLPWPSKLTNAGKSWTHERVVVAALNMGNESNLQRLMDGYGLTENHIRLIQSKLTAEEWRAVQSIWNTINSLWPQVADTHERLKYYRPKKIEAQGFSVTTADGQQLFLDGGYYPAAYDKELDNDAARWGEKEDLLASHEAVMQVPIAKSGFAKSRADRVNRPIDLSLNNLSVHFTDIIKFITLAEVTRDADRVFQDRELVNRNMETIGQDMHNAIRPALQNVLRPERRLAGGLLERGRVAMSTFYMGYNAWTAIQNVTGVFPAIRQVGFNNYLDGIAQTISNPLKSHKAMLQMSGYMRLRETNIERELKGQISDFKIGGMEINGKRYTFKDVQSLAFAGIRLIDSIVALPAWYGRYNSEMEKHGDMQRAVESADSSINKALGSGLAIDSTGTGRHQIWSLFAPFMSFASTQQEVLTTERQAWKEGKISTSEFLYGHLMTWLAPAIMSTFLQGALMYGLMGAIGGGDDDKREKGGMDYLTDILSYRMMGIPYLRDIFNGVIQGVEKKAPITSARMPIAEAFRMAQQLGYRMGNMDGSEKTVKAAMWSAAELTSLYLHIPATRIFERWQKGTKNIESGHGWWGNHFIPQEKKK